MFMKQKKSPMLPQVKRAVTGVKRPVWAPTAQVVLVLIGHDIAGKLRCPTVDLLCFSHKHDVRRGARVAPHQPVV
jgi:hypothetical protein